MNAPSLSAPPQHVLREEFDDLNTLVMPNRPGAGGTHFASGVMPRAQAASGVMPVAAHVAPSAEMPTADVLASYPPATAEPTPLSVPPLPVASIAPASMPQMAGTTYEGSYAFQPSAPSDGRGRVAFIIILGFLIGIGGTYSYQVATHRPPAASEPVPARTSKPAEAKPEAKPAAAKPAETKPAETKPAETKSAETKPAPKTPAAPKAAASVVSSRVPPAADPRLPPLGVSSTEPKPQEPSQHAAKHTRPKKARSSAEPALEGRNLLSEGLE
jgi:hypothetical protein